MALDPRNDPRDPPAGRTHFSSPREVLESSTLTTDRKRSLLLEWLQDERALAVAEDEGMRGGRAPETGSVLRALLSLHGSAS